MKEGFVREKIRPCWFVWIEIEWNEEGYNRLCDPLSHMSTSKGRTSKARGIATTSTDTKMEMRTHIYGFCSGFTKDTIKSWYYLVVVDRLTKSAHFLATRSSDYVDKLARLYVKEVLRIHGILVSIVSNRDLRFTSRLWGSFQQAIGTNLNFSIAFHPQIDG